MLSRASFDISDDFFSDICNQKSEDLLVSYTKFLKFKGDTKHVAQYKRELNFKLKEITNLLVILKYLDFLKPMISLSLEKTILELRLQILDFGKKKSVISRNKSQNGMITDRLNPNIKLNNLHNEISKLIKSQGKVRNLDIFIKFSYISKRTLKRKLSELVLAGAIRREARGKTVFYFPVG